MKIIEAIKTATPEITQIRKHLHQNPELSFQERETAQYIVKLLESWGIEVHQGLARTGLVGVIKNGNSSKAIGLRADMDALPIVEQNAFTHASCHQGVMHACGHDGHMAMLLGAAQYLSKNKTFDGTVYFIFQPAEEDGGGGRVMVEEGLFERFPMDAVFGMHNWPGIPVGTAAASPGPVMASSNEFKVCVQGKGTHAAMPHLGIDPVPIACQIITAWQQILTRQANPFDQGVLSVTTIHAGKALNVISNTCEFGGTVRTFLPHMTDLIEARMKAIAEHICAGYGASCTFEFERLYIPTVNTEQEVALSREVLLSILPPEQVLEQQPSMGAEDFGFMLAKKPGAYIFMGQGQGEHRVQGHGLGPCELHNPSYDFNDALLPLGATYWVRLVEKFLAT